MIACYDYEGKAGRDNCFKPWRKIKEIRLRAAGKGLQEESEGAAEQREVLLQRGVSFELHSDARGKVCTVTCGDASLQHITVFRRTGDCKTLS